jgi:Ca2+-binding RTX toxin-like protein
LVVRGLLTILALLALLVGNASAGGSVPPVTGGITSVRLQSTSGSLKPGEMISFGQAFARGDVPAGTGLVATVGGQAVPLQMDVKATHADGSVRHAILTVAAPEGSSSALGVTLNRGNTSASTVDAVQAARDLLAAGYDLKVQVTTGGQTYTADAAAALSSALATGLDVWMKGDLATEFRVNAAITDALLATFDIRAYDNGEIRTDVTISNDWITSKDGVLHQPTAVTYDVAIKQGGQTVFSHNSLNHHQNANWHTQIWADGSGPAARVIRDVDYLAKTGAVPAIDTSIAVNESTLQNQWNALQEADTGPMGSALWTTYMPTTGGRFDIGMVTGWQALYLISQDPRAEEIILKMADVAGSVPWHLRDAATGGTLTIDDHPGFTTYGRNGSGVDKLQTPYTTEGTGWHPDSAHQPAMSYVPYLVTGDRYHLDELHAEANTHITGTLYERNGDDGLFYLGQIRGQAWALRSLGSAAYITPDDDPLKGYFADKLNNNINYQLARDLSAAGDVEGYIFDEIHKGGMAPWQDDFYTAVISQLSMQGIESAAALTDWKINFTAGRFISEDKGFNPLAGTNYGMLVADAGRNPWRLFDSWSETYQTFVAENGAPTTLLANYLGGYADIARGTLANLITTTGDSRAIEAYGFLVGETQHKFASGIGGNPTWSIAPRLADGGLVQDSDITVAGDGGEMLTGGGGSQLLHGKGGNDTIAGGAGSDLLFGGDGDDALSGGDADDHLFGGKGSDTLNGGPGNDFLKGNQGRDKFQFARSGDGRDIIADFESGLDRLEISGVTNADAQSLIAKATADPDDNAVLHLTPDDDITLFGISVNELQTSFFLLQ